MCSIFEKLCFDLNSDGVARQLGLSVAATHVEALNDLTLHEAGLRSLLASGDKHSLVVSILEARVDVAREDLAHAVAYEVIEMERHLVFAWEGVGGEAEDIFVNAQADLHGSIRTGHGLNEEVNIVTVMIGLVSQTDNIDLAYFPSRNQHDWRDPSKTRYAMRKPQLMLRHT